MAALFPPPPTAVPLTALLMPCSELPVQRNLFAQRHLERNVQQRRGGQIHMHADLDVHCVWPVSPSFRHLACMPVQELSKRYGLR